MPKPVTYGCGPSTVRRATSRAFSGPKWRTQLMTIRPSMPVSVAGVVDALGERGEVLLVGQADVGGVVGRGGQLDVDRALGRAA